MEKKKKEYEHIITIRQGKPPISGTEIYVPTRPILNLRLQEIIFVAGIGIVLGVILMVFLV